MKTTISSSSWKIFIVLVVMASSVRMIHLRRGVARAWMMIPSTARRRHGAPKLEGGATRTRLFSTTTPATTLSVSSSLLVEEEEVSIYKELESLSTEIRRHDDLYYNQEPELTDEDFDALVRREEEISTMYPTILARWQKQSGLGMASTRSGRVGTAALPATTITTTRLKRQHLHPMLSLDNVHNSEQLKTWLKRIQRAVTEETQVVTILTEPKLDGVSLSLRYQKVRANDKNNGSTQHRYDLVWASTRGDGNQGQDVTAAVRSMNKTILPDQFSISNTNNAGDGTTSSLGDIIEIRGEVVMPKTTFESLDVHIGNHTFSNARNAASGILLRKAPVDVLQDEVEAADSQQLRSLLQFYAYDLVANKKASIMLDGSQTRQWLNEWGFQVPMPVATTSLSTVNTTADWTDEEVAPMISYHQNLADYRDNNKLSSDSSTNCDDWGDFEMDGCVHKVADVSIRQALGRSMKSPNWAVAHKFPPLSAVSNLLDVTIQVGRTGALTPVAILEPVQVGGVSIQRATLHNFLHLRQTLGSGGGENGEYHSRLPSGTPVLVRRAGDVIPQVVQRISNSIDNNNKNTTTNDVSEKDSMISLEPPTHCPACGSPVVWEETASKVAGSNGTNTMSQVVRCGGQPLLCPPRAVTSLAHAYSRDALDITGLSEARIEQLMEAQRIRFPSDIFHFQESDWNATAELPGWGPKSCTNLRNAARQVAQNGVSLGRFVYALGIRHVGKHSSELVASVYGSAEAFLKALEAASEWSENDSDGIDQTDDTINSDDSDGADDSGCNEPFPELQGTLGIGPVMVNSLLSFSKSKDLVQAAKELADGILVLEQPTTATIDQTDDDSKSDSTRPWEGFRVVFTGALPGMSRSEAQNAAKEVLGAKSTPGTVSKSTNIVVYGDKGGKKLEQAKSFGVKTMSAEEFSALLDSNKEDA